MKGGLATVGIGQSSADVTFSPAYADTNYIVIIAVENETDGVAGASQGYYFSIENKAPTGFRIQIRNNNTGAFVTVPDAVTFSYAVVPLPAPTP